MDRDSKFVKPLQERIDIIIERLAVSERLLIKLLAKISDLERQIDSLKDTSYMLE